MQIATVIPQLFTMANIVVDESTLHSDGSTLTVKALGIDTAQIKANAVTTAKILDGNVTATKSVAVYSLSNNVLLSYDAEGETANQTYTKVKTITITSLTTSPTTLRIYFQLKAVLGNFIQYGRIYKNGVAFGTERSTLTNDYSAVYSEDLAFSNGDTVELWLKANVAGDNPRTRYLRVLGDSTFAPTSITGTNS
jgi:hypothetical protein